MAHLCPSCAVILRDLIGAQEGVGQPRPIGQLIPDFLESKRQAGRCDKYIIGLRQYLTAFTKGRESLPVSAIGLNELEEWFSGRSESPQSRNSNLGRLSAFFDYAWRRKFVAENPCRRIEKIAVATKPPMVLTNDQTREAFAWTERQFPKFLAWLTLTLFVGLRPEAEADVLDWSDVDMDNARIVVTKSKVCSHRIIDLTMCPPAGPWLAKAKKSCSPLKIPPITRRRYVRALRDALGLGGWPQDILRHTAASNLLAFHQDAGKVAMFLGHSASTLHRKYKALIVPEKAKEFFSILPII